ncbi:unnamed protein product, partial [Closterium sp. NIES-53]
PPPHPVMRFTPLRLPLTPSTCPSTLFAHPSVKPSKGDALLFYSMHPDGSPDPSSLHYACPVVEGVKWSAPKWIHVADFSKAYSGPSGGVGLADMAGGGQGVLSGCIDANAFCPSWAASGECEKNPAYMHESCRKSCKQC